MKDTRQLVFNALKNAAPNGDINADAIQIPMREYSIASNLLLYLFTEGGGKDQLESAGRAISTLTLVALLAGEGNPAAFEGRQKELFRSRAKNARGAKLPPHLVDRIVIEAMEDPSLPASERATAPKPRRALLPLAGRKRDVINDRIAEDRKRYDLPVDEPYFSQDDSIYRRYLAAKKRTVI